MGPEDKDVVTTAAQAVYDALGPWHTEKVYQNALRIELGDVATQVEVSVPIHYKNVFVGLARLDLTWKNHIIEVKTVPSTTRKERGQCGRYQRLTGKSVVLVTFGPSGPVIEYFDA